MLFMLKYPENDVNRAQPRCFDDDKYTVDKIDKERNYIECLRISLNMSKMSVERKRTLCFARKIQHQFKRRNDLNLLK